MPLVSPLMPALIRYWHKKAIRQGLVESPIQEMEKGVHSREPVKFRNNKFHLKVSCNIRVVMLEPC